jgi:hypothetical protein
MSYTLQLRAGEKVEQSQLPDVALYGLSRLKKSGFAQEVDLFLGDDKTRPGQRRNVNRRDLLQAIERLLPPVKGLPAGFRVFDEGDSDDLGARGLASLLIDGVYYAVRCRDDYWTLSPLSALRKGQWIPPEMRGFNRYEPAEIQTENLGIVKVKATGATRSVLENVLREAAAFLRNLNDEYVDITIG